MLVRFVRFRELGPQESRVQVVALLVIGAPKLQRRSSIGDDRLDEVRSGPTRAKPCQQVDRSGCNNVRVLQPQHVGGEEAEKYGRIDIVDRE